MGFLDSLFGRKEKTPPQTMRDTRPLSPDEQAIARYKYMLQTAPPEDIERAHTEAFARLTPQQRQMALQQLSAQLPDSERTHLTDEPQSLARAATRMEMQRPGALQQTFGGGGMMGGSPMGGMMGMMAGGILASLAGSFIASSIASSFFSNPMNEQAFQQSPEASGDLASADTTDYAANDGYIEGIDANGNADPLGDPGLTDPYGDPGAFDGGGFDSGFDSGFDGGGFDGGGDFF